MVHNKQTHTKAADLMQPEVSRIDRRREQAFKERYLDQRGGQCFAGVGASLWTKELGACLKGPPRSDW